MKPLTSQMISNKTRTDNISMIKALNLWGNEIDDISILQELPHLETLCLSVNKINTLKPL